MKEEQIFVDVKSQLVLASAFFNSENSFILFITHLELSKSRGQSINIVLLRSMKATFGHFTFFLDVNGFLLTLPFFTENISNLAFVAF